MRSLLLAAGILTFVGWLVGAVFVVAQDPRTERVEVVEPALLRAPLSRGRGGSGGGLFGVEFEGAAGEATPRAYVRSYGARFGAEEGPSVADRAAEDRRDGYDIFIRRGRLDRSSASFPLTVIYRVPRPGALAQVEVHVSDDPDTGLEDPGWRPLGSAPIEAEEGWSVAMLHAPNVAASCASLRVTETRVDGERFRISSSLPQAPTLAGRLYDRVAWWAPFRWLPRLR